MPAELIGLTLLITALIIATGCRRMQERMELEDYHQDNRRPYQPTVLRNFDFVVMVAKRKELHWITADTWKDAVVQAQNDGVCPHDISGIYPFHEWSNGLEERLRENGWQDYDAPVKQRITA